MVEPEDAWKSKAAYDLETAKAMLKARRFVYVLFCCQQAVEKHLKGMIAERQKTCPPRIHHLVRLAELTEIGVDDRQQAFLRELSSYYIQTRYPDEIAAMDVSRETAQEILSQTEEFITWLQSTP